MLAADPLLFRESCFPVGQLSNGQGQLLFALSLCAQDPPNHVHHQVRSVVLSLVKYVGCLLTIPGRSSRSFLRLAPALQALPPAAEVPVQ